jgi:hypothetical protein
MQPPSAGGMTHTAANCDSAKTITFATVDTSSVTPITTADGAVLDVVYADLAMPEAFLAERWVAKGRKQLLTS